MYFTLQFFKKQTQGKPQIDTEDHERKFGFSWGLLLYWVCSGQYINLLVFKRLFLIHLSFLITFKDLYWRSYVSFNLYKFDPYFFFKERIFQDVGKGLLGHLFQGYNCTLFAYGQTGSGKSYTIMERGVNKGAEQYNFTVSGQCITTTSLFIA